MGGWVGYKIDIDDVEKRKFIALSNAEPEIV
jgi:hypothetical protein